MAQAQDQPDPEDNDCDHGGSPGVTVCRYCAPNEAGDEKRPWANLDIDAQQSADVIERWAPRTAAVIRYRSGVVELQRRHDALTAEVARHRAAIEQTIRALDRIVAEPPRSERLRAISVALAADLGDGA